MPECLANCRFESCPAYLISFMDGREEVIQLKTKQPELSGAVMLGDLPNLLHDCAVAHAYQEATSEVCGGVTDNRILVAIGVIETRAAEILKEWGVE